MVSPEVRNSTKELAASPTTSTAPLAREESSAGFFNPDEQPAEVYYGNYTQDYDHVDTSGNYKETPLRFLKKKAYRKSWGKLVQANGVHDDQEFDTGEIDSIQDLTEKINSGELYPTAQIIEELGERALALVPLVDVELPASKVEKTILGVVAVNPKFEDKAVAAVDKIYHSKRPGVTPETQKVARDTVRKIALVAAHIDDYIDLDNVYEPVPAIDRIVEQGTNMVTTPRINRIVQAKEWAEEDRLAAEQEKISA